MTSIRSNCCIAGNYGVGHLSFVLQGRPSTATLALKPFIPEGLSLKWPNDIFVDGLKLGGILIQDHDTVKDALAIGVGINVNSTLDDFPPEARGQRTTMRDQLGTQISRERVISRIAAAIVEQVERFEGGDWDGILAEYRELSYLIDREGE